MSICGKWRIDQKFRKMYLNQLVKMGYLYLIRIEVSLKKKQYAFLFKSCIEFAIIFRKINMRRMLIYYHFSCHLLNIV